VWDTILREFLLTGTSIHLGINLLDLGQSQSGLSLFRIVSEIALMLYLALKR
jgi:hypothetical protein